MTLRTSAYFITLAVLTSLCCVMISERHFYRSLAYAYEGISDYLMQQYRNEKALSASYQEQLIECRRENVLNKN